MPRIMGFSERNPGRGAVEFEFESVLPDDTNLERNGRLRRPTFKQVGRVSSSTNERAVACRQGRPLRLRAVERNWRFQRQIFKQAVLVSRSFEGERSEPEMERETSLELATSTLGRLRSTR
jgi:hypothetical protein